MTLWFCSSLFFFSTKWEPSTEPKQSHTINAVLSRDYRRVGFLVIFLCEAFTICFRCTDHRWRVHTNRSLRCEFDLKSEQNLSKLSFAWRHLIFVVNFNWKSNTIRGVRAIEFFALILTHKNRLTASKCQHCHTQKTGTEFAFVLMQPSKLISVNRRNFDKHWFLNSLHRIIST